MYVGSLFVCQNLFGRFARLDISDMSYDTFDDRSSASKASSYSYEDDQQNFSFDDAQKSELRSAGISDDVMEQVEGYARQHSRKPGPWFGGSQVFSEEADARDEHKRSKKSGSWFNMGGISKALSAAMSLAMMFVLKKSYDTYVSPEGRAQLITEAVVAAKDAVKNDDDLKKFITEDGQNELAGRLGEKAGEKALEKILANPALQQFVDEEQRKAMVGAMAYQVGERVTAQVLANDQLQQFVNEDRRNEVVTSMVQAFKANLNAKELGTEFAQGIAATGFMGAVKSWWNG